MPAGVCFDASTLINFAEAGAITLLARHFATRAFISAYVEDNELVATTARGIKVLTHGGARWIERVDISGAAELRRASEIQLSLGTKQRHRGESESMVICLERKTIFATDDGDAAQIARVNSIRVASTIDILNSLVAKQHLAADQALRLAQKMRDCGQNVNPQLLL